MIQINKVVPDICKHESCLKRALYEFTDLSNVGTLTINASSEDDNNMFIKQSTVTIGYSCEHHVEEVNKMLKNIYHEENFGPPYTTAQSTVLDEIKAKNKIKKDKKNDKTSKE